MLPGNRAAWRAWHLVRGCRSSVGMGPGGIAWADARAVLELYGLWCVEIHRKLSACDAERRMIEAEEQESKRQERGSGH